MFFLVLFKHAGSYIRYVLYSHLFSYLKKKTSRKKMLFTGQKTVPLVLSTALGLRPRAQSFPIRTSRPVNNIYLFFSQASERAGFLNPRIWLANHAHVTGPAFYHTAHGPDFFPLNAAPKFRSWKLAVIVSLLPLLQFHRWKVNAG